MFSDSCVLDARFRLLSRTQFEASIRCLSSPVGGFLQRTTRGPLSSRSFLAFEGLTLESIRDVILDFGFLIRCLLKLGFGVSESQIQHWFPKAR